MGYDNEHVVSVLQPLDVFEFMGILINYFYAGGWMICRFSIIQVHFVFVN